MKKEKTSYEKNFAYNLRKLRIENGDSALDLAKKIGVTKQMVSLYETSQNMPKAQTIQKIANVYGCNVSDLFVEL